MPARVPTATSFRSTWLSSSIRSIKQRNLYPRYLQLLPREYHPVVENSIAGVWLPMDVAFAHYKACDSLDLSKADLFAIGQEVTAHANQTALAFVVRLAKTSGATPWTLLSQHQRVWDRTWIGGACGIWKVGPKDAVVEIAGWPCARFTYMRVAFRGVLFTLTNLFATKAYVKDEPELFTDTTLGYRVSWA